MTIILFLVDTSASMNQRTYLGTSLIDISKASVESFMKVNDAARSDLLLGNQFRCNIRAYFILIAAIFLFRSGQEMRTADGIDTCC